MRKNFHKILTADIVSIKSQKLISLSQTQTGKLRDISQNLTSASQNFVISETGFLGL